MDVGYVDLNLIYSNEDDSHLLLERVAGLGYSKVCLTVRAFSEEFANARGPAKNKPKVEPVENPIKLSSKSLLLKTPDGLPLQIFRRLSVTIQDSRIFHDLANNPVCKTYDLISVVPFDEKSLQQSLDDISVDIVELDLTRPRPVNIKRSHARQAESNGKFFEICYDAAFLPSDSRVTFLSNTRRLVVNLCPGNRGKLPDAVVLSSGAETVEQVKNPAEVQSMCHLFGFPEKWSTKMNSAVAWAALNSALARRRTAKNAVQLII